MDNANNAWATESLSTPEVDDEALLDSLHFSFRLRNLTTCARCLLRKWRVCNMP